MADWLLRTRWGAHCADRRRKAAGSRGAPLLLSLAGNIGISSVSEMYLNVWYGCVLCMYTKVYFEYTGVY